MKLGRSDDCERVVADEKRKAAGPCRGDCAIAHLQISRLGLSIGIMWNVIWEIR